MNLRALAVLAVAVALPLSGCVLVARADGDVSFSWTFEGQSCAQVPGVANVRISIPGQSLMNSGVFPCSSAGAQGIRLLNFAGGLYTYTVDALDNQNRVLYSSSGSFTVDGSVSVNVNLAAVGGSNAYAFLVWTFPPNSAATNPTCEQAGVTTVKVSVDGSAWTSVPCVDGQSASGAQFGPLQPGNHTIDLSAVNATDYEYYSLRSSLPVTAGQSSSQQYDLNWAVGGVTVRWTITSGGQTQTCAQAGLSTVLVNFQDAQGNLVYGSQWDPKQCNVTSVSYPFLKPGVYRVFLSATGAGTLYESSTTAPPSVTVTAGFFQGPNDGPNLILNRVQ